MQYDPVVNGLLNRVVISCKVFEIAYRCESVDSGYSYEVYTRVTDNLFNGKH